MGVKVRKEWFFYGVAAGALAFAVSSIMKSQPEVERLEPLGPITTTPFENTIAAAGVVEPSSRIIEVAPDIEGVVAAIHVAPGERISIGAPLFSLDARRFEAAVEEAAARLARAEAEVELRRAEARAAEASAEATRVVAARLRNSVERHRPIAADTMSAEDFETMVADASSAAYEFRAAIQTARSALAAVNASMRDADLARAALAGAEADLARTIMRSPINGAVLSIDARAGQAVRPGDVKPATISVGAIDTLIARVEIDETEAARFRQHANASAYLRGQAGAPALSLQFQSIEPMLKPKSSFRDLSAEYVETRVLEARYLIENTGETPLYVGQLLDVFVDADTGAPAVNHTPRRRTTAPVSASFGSSVNEVEEEKPLRP
ncbi:MAG: HlyD family efflux transporter periplasmic adaptor subunit [Pseudomonadota bacterium]